MVDTADLSHSNVIPIWAAAGRRSRAGAVVNARPGRPAGNAAGSLHMLDFLRSMPALRPLFDELAPELAQDVADGLEWCSVRAEEVLFAEGDTESDAFIIISGELGARRGHEFGGRIVARMGAGQMVGQAALVADGPRAETVIALEDSHVVRLPRAAAKLLMEGSDRAARFLFRALHGSIRQTCGAPARAVAAERIAVIPLERTTCTGATLEWLSRRMRSIRVAADEEKAARRCSDAANGRVVAYIADGEFSAWTRRCIDQCSRVLFVASAGGGRTEQAAVTYAKQMRRDVTVVVVNDADVTAPTGGTEWLQHVPATSILHVRSRNEPDHERMLRLISRTATCVVFSGGGARALAHIGAVKALEENGIAIDMVGGTSMGALIAGQVAQGFTAQTILDRMYRYVVETNPLQDFTLPFVSLVRGRKITRTFKEACDGALIENLWKPFFCVSADLTTGTAVLHQSGALWQALRASSAIPGIFPPVMDQGRVLVDGGVVDTFPTAAMRTLGRGKVVGCVTSSNCRIEATNVAVEEKSLLWMLRNGRREMPSISRILMSSGMMTRRPLMAASRAAADVLIEPALSHISMFSFKSFDKAVEAGYRAALQAIPQLKLLSREGALSVLEAA